jgi:hypothetical protein
MDHTEYVGRSFDQIRVYAAGHPQVLVALVRTQRMLRGACVLVGGRDHIVAALDRQIVQTVECCDPAMLPEDRARVELAAQS